MVQQRSSGLDFSDRGLSPHPDLPIDAGASHLQRNRTERFRLQGLQRSFTAKAATVGPQSLQEKIKIWMINDGGRQLFFGVYIFLHVLVWTLGFLHYQLKDNSEGARLVFGPTFRTFSVSGTCRDTY